MKCITVTPYSPMAKINYSRNFKGINDVDNSRTVNDRIGSKEYYVDRTIQYNDRGNVLHHLYKTYKNGDLINRNTYDCTYFENKNKKEEKYLNDDFLHREQSVTLTEYYSSGKVKNYVQKTRSI